MVVLREDWSSSLGAKPPSTLCTQPATQTVFVDLLASRLGVRAEMTGLEGSGQLSDTADTEKLDTGRSGQGWTLTPPTPTPRAAVPWLFTYGV